LAGCANRPRWTARLVVAAALLGSSWLEARGEDLTGYVEATVADVENADGPPGSDPLDSEFRTSGQRLHFTWTRRLFPMLTFWAGGTFDRSDTRSVLEGEEFRTDQQESRPFLGLRRQGTHHNGQVLWTGDDRRVDPEGGLSSRTRREGLFGAWTWRPRWGPTTRATATRATERDDAGTRDLTTRQLDLLVSQVLRPELRASYRGAFSDNEDDVSGTVGRTLTHRGRLEYEDAWRDRVWLRSDYNVVRRDSRLESRGLGELVEALFPLAGLFARDETPLDGPLDPLAALIDDDTATATGIDLGLASLPAEQRPWSIGLDLGDRIAPDVLFVWVDRTIERASLAASLTWRVFVSDDNLTWTPTQTIAAAPFDDFQRRFELRLTPVAARYVKVVVAPLTPDVPFSAELPDLLVTELSAARVLTAPGSTVEDGRTTQSLSADARARLLADLDFFYEGSVFGTIRSGEDLRWRSSNGLYYTQPFREVWRISARAAYEHADEARVESRALVYSSTLSVVPVPRLRWTLAFSGRREMADVLFGGDQDSVFLYGAAGLYDGVDVQLGVGRSWITDPTGRRLVSTQIDFTGTLQPRDDLTIGVAYLDSSSERLTGDVLGLFDLFTRYAEVNAGWTPFPTTYLYGSYRVEWRSETARDDVTTLVLNFAPFPAGALRLGMNYSQSRRTLTDRDERAYGPTLRWNLNPRAYLETSYRVIRDTSPSRRFDNDVLAATLRWGF
jgi:hypothetical protein